MMGYGKIPIASVFLLFCLANLQVYCDCPPNCRTCTYYEGGTAATCKHCMDGYYATSDHDQCQQLCSSGCRTCINSSMCTECYYFHYLLINFIDSAYCIEKGIPAPQCNIPCSCCKMTCDTDISCGGNCNDGYHGGRCKNRCPRNCLRCVDAQQGGGVSNCTLCKDGFFSTTTLYQCQQHCPAICKSCNSLTYCTSCIDGYYLAASNQCTKCNYGCVTCISQSSCTSCKAGFYKDGGVCKRCSPLCSTCLSPDECVCSIGCETDDDNPCHTSTGSCFYGCKPNFESGLVMGCLSCQAGFFGYECQRNCSVDCVSTCDRKTGKCTVCKTGYFGDFCTPCPHNCESTCNVHGNCDACKDGYYGLNCTQNCTASCAACSLTAANCTKCNVGSFGKGCEMKCSDNCLLNKCKKDSGKCENCELGYDGDTCDIKVTSTDRTTINSMLVITEDPGQFTAPAIGGTIGGLVIIGVLIVIIIVLRRRVTYKHPQYLIQLDSYKLDLSSIDVLEENDEFDPTYFTGTVDDDGKPCDNLPVNELAKFVESHGVDYYQDEFLKLPRGLIKPCDDAKKDGNIIKNRYTGIYPYDEHRVRLLPPGSDFINASYIDGFDKRREYIASLGPTMKAMEHFQLFWRMVWQEKTDVIVMVTNLIEGHSVKCEQYWPNIGTSSTYGEITVTSLTEETYSEFVVKTLIVARDGEQRDLHHVHYTAWPDKRVPDDITSLIEFRQKVKSIKPVLGGPTIVHCSAGIGHTGTYIALDILINQGKAQKALDIFDWVTRMREQRTSMVQTCEQYEYLHRALVHALTNYCEPITAKKFGDFMNTSTDKRMTELFERFQDKKERSLGTEDETGHIYTDLIREGGAISGDQHHLYADLDETRRVNNCINAVYVNSYTVKNRFLIAQTPHQETVKDFLTLITQENCVCIVSLDSPGLKDQKSGDYFSTTNGGVFTHPSYMFEVETQELDSNPSYILRRLTLRSNEMSGSTSRTVYHYQCSHWPQENQVPNITHFLQLVQDVEDNADKDKGKGPVLVHCFNGAERSGLYCAVSNLIQKMRLEGEVSVVNTLKQIKVRRPLVIPNKDQFLFSYQCVVQFVTSETGKGDLAIYGKV